MARPVREVGAAPRSGYICGFASRVRVRVRVRVRIRVRVRVRVSVRVRVKVLQLPWSRTFQRGPGWLKAQCPDHRAPRARTLHPAVSEPTLVKEGIGVRVIGFG